MYKICVYAICKNELKFVDRWLENVSEADYIVVLDTGSTDGTYEKLKADKRVTVVKQKEIKPWRFDVARNESMKLIPKDTDICVCTDFDELFVPGWAKAVRENWQENTNRMFYTYAWGQTANGDWHDVFRGDKIHSLKGFR
jgi:glycosyltransferase involved in cell wall biosynthesis